MFIAEEEHDGTWIVELVHLVEIRDFVDINEIEDGKVLALVCDAVEDFVLLFAGVVPVAAEADYHDSVVFRHDGLVDVPACVQMWEKVRHDAVVDLTAL